jgi:hypothetical protein
LTKFHITDGKGTVYGSVSVPNEAAADLRKCWRDSAPAAGAPGDEKARVAKAMVANLRKGPKLNREAILRGC